MNYKKAAPLAMVAFLGAMSATNAFAMDLDKNDIQFVENLVTDVRTTHSYDGMDLKDSFLEACHIQSEVFDYQNYDNIKTVECGDPYSPKEKMHIYYDNNIFNANEAMERSAEERFMNGDIGFLDMIGSKIYENVASALTYGAGFSSNGLIHAHVRQNGLGETIAIMPSSASHSATSNHDPHLSEKDARIAQLEADTTGHHEMAHGFLKAFFTDELKSINNMDMSQHHLFAEHLAMVSHTMFRINAELQYEGIYNETLNQDSLMNADSEHGNRAIEIITENARELYEQDVGRKEGHDFSHLAGPLGYYVGRTLAQDPEAIRLASDDMASAVYSFTLLYSIMEERGHTNENGTLDFNNIGDSGIYLGKVTKTEANDFNTVAYGIDALTLESLTYKKSVDFHKDTFKELLTSKNGIEDITKDNFLGMYDKSGVDEKIAKTLGLNGISELSEEHVEQLKKALGLNSNSVDVSSIIEGKAIKIDKEFTDKVMNRTIAVLNGVGFDFSKLDMENDVRVAVLSSDYVDSNINNNYNLEKIESFAMSGTETLQDTKSTFTKDSKIEYNIDSLENNESENDNKFVNNIENKNKNKNRNKNKMKI